MDIKNLKFSAEEIDSLLNKIKNLDLSNIEANANIDLTIGQVETVENIENASASIVKNGDSYKLNLSIPKGEKGDKGSNGGTPSFSIGTVSTGSTPQVIMTGDFPNYILNFVFPTVINEGSGSGEESGTISGEIETKITNLENTVSTLQIINDLKINYSYIMATFDYEAMKLNILGSKDGIAFNVLYENCYTPKLGKKTLRDPSIIYHNGYFYITYTVIDWGEGNTIGMAKSKDLENWEELPQLVTSTTFTKVWAPAWFEDKGKLYIIVNGSTDGINFKSYIFEYLEDSHQLNNMNLISIKGRDNVIDTHIYKYGQKYIITTKDETKKTVLIGFADDFIGEFDMTYANLTDSIINREGSFLVALPNGCIRIYEEDYITKKLYFRDSNMSLSFFSDEQLVSNDDNLKTSHPSILDLNNIGFSVTKNEATAILLQNTVYTKDNFNVLPNCLYYIENVTVATINSINTVFLKTGDKVYFASLTGSSGGITMNRDNATFWTPYSSLTLEKDYIYQFVFFKNKLYLCKD